MTFPANREAIKQLLYLRRKKLGRAGRRRAKVSTPWLYPWGAEKQYATMIKSWLKPMMDYVHNYLDTNQEALLRGDSATSLHHDAQPGESYRRMVKSLNGWLAINVPDPDATGEQRSPPTILMGLGKMAEGVNSFNQKQWFKASKAELGVEFPMYEDWWPATKKTWQEENYKHIKKMSQDYIDQINQKAEQAVRSGWSVSQLKSEILKVDSSIKSSRANLIARDQIGKLNGQVTEARMGQAGLTMYIWSTGKDERVRGNPAGHFPFAKPSHFIMEGLLCRWDDITVYSDDKGKTWKPRPSGAVLLHPGQDIQCRCTALSYWEELVGEVDSVIAKEEGYHVEERPMELFGPTFEGVSKRIYKSTGVSLNEAIKELDIGAVNEVMRGVEKVIKTFPELNECIKNFLVFEQDSGVLMDSNCYGEIRFNKKHFNNKKTLIENLCHYKKGLTIEDIGSHEMGHLLEKILIEKDTRFGKSFFKLTDAWNKQIISTEIVTQAIKEIINSEKTKKTRIELLMSISEAATYSYAEAMADAVMDYIKNGKTSQNLSKKIVSIIKRRLK